MSRFSCIIFDLDGTLTRTNELIFATFNHVADKYVGRTFQPAEITAMFGPPEEIAIEKIVGQSSAASAMEDFFDFYRSNHLRMAGSYEGIGELLQSLHSRGVLLALFTGKGHRSTTITLEMLDLRRYFTMIVTGNDVEHHKPSSEGIRKIMHAFELSPDDVLMVGDAVNDIKAAREAGVQIAAVVWDSYARDRVMHMDVDSLFHTVEDFATWVYPRIATNGTMKH